MSDGTGDTGFAVLWYVRRERRRCQRIGHREYPECAGRGIRLSPTIGCDDPRNRVPFVDTGFWRMVPSRFANAPPTRVRTRLSSREVSGCATPASVAGG